MNILLPTFNDKITSACLKYSQTLTYENLTAKCII